MRTPDQVRDRWLLAGTAAAIAFGLLGVLVAYDPTLVSSFDERMSAAVATIPIDRAAWERLTSLGGQILVPIGIAVCGFALVTRTGRVTVVCATTLIAASLFTDLAKDLVARPRPIEGLESLLGFSYPSGHTLNSTATYGLIALLISQSGVSPWIRRGAVALLVTLPVLVGLSRVALGVHFATDVVGGWLAGFAFVAFAAVAIDASGAIASDLRGHEP